MKTPDTVIRELELGFVPYELSFSIPEVGYDDVVIDWTAMDYSEYDTFDFWSQTHLPDGLLEQWPCLEEWARNEYESREQRTPLQEMELRSKACLEEQALEIGEKESLEDNINNVYTEELCNSEN